MPHYERETVSITTDGSGGTGSTSVANGHLVGIVYTKPGSNGLDTATVVITGATSGITLWSKTGVDASVDVYPLGPAVKAADGSSISNTGVVVPIASEAILVTVTSAGSTKSGTFEFIINGTFNPG